ncbi:hypothetical protein ACOME3_002982 [Neoechinorhynchus agilis]
MGLVCSKANLEQNDSFKDINESLSQFSISIADDDSLCENVILDVSALGNPGTIGQISERRQCTGSVKVSNSLKAVSLRSKSSSVTRLAIMSKMRRCRSSVFGGSRRSYQVAIYNSNPRLRTAKLSKSIDCDFIARKGSIEGTYTRSRTLNRTVMQ